MQSSVMKLGEQDQVVAVLAGALLDAVVRDEVGLAAKDRLDHEARTVGAHGVEVVGLLPDAHVGGPLRVNAVMRRGVRRIGLRLLKVPALLEALDVVAPLAHVLLGVVVLAALHVKVRDAKHVAVVGEGQGRHAEVDGTLDHVRDAGGGVEDREVRVIVKVDESHVMVPRQLGVSRVVPRITVLARADWRRNGPLSWVRLRFRRSQAQRIFTARAGAAGRA